MNYEKRLAISYYKNIAAINEAHHVYLVQHQETGKIAVKKVLQVYEADVFSDLQAHPVDGIPKILDLYEENGTLTVIEEYVSGTTLQEMIEAKSLTRNRIGDYAARLCSILTKLHERIPPLVHRDIKPSNIIITAYDAVVLLDFNAAKYYSGASNRRADTKLLGTQGYAAPEQYGFGESSPQTDIYSVGVLLREAVQSLPLQDHTFDAVIDRCTQMEPSKRYPSAKALQAAILRCTSANVAKERLSGAEVLPGSVAAIQIFPNLPPGFRTMNPGNIVAAVLGYIAIFYITLTMKVNETTGAELWMERIGMLIIALLVVMILFDYRGIQRIAPFYRSRRVILRVLGTLLLTAAVTFVTFIGLVFLVGVFFHFGR